MRVNVILPATLAAALLAHGQFISQQQNAPFSGDSIATRVQTLADGTHITSPETVTKLYRDSLGRTRSETYGPTPEPAQSHNPQMIQIVDPVEGAQYLLTPNSKTARRMTTPKRNPVPPAVPQTAVPAFGAIANGIQLYPASGGIAVARPFGGGQPTAAPQSKNEKLGTQNIEGLIAEGQRFTTTWAVGSIGNDRELVTTNESWRSTELGIVVLSKNSDPRTGERTTKLTNISRAEPDASLFQVPADYTIEEQPAPTRIQSPTPTAAGK